MRLCGEDPADPLQRRAQLLAAQGVESFNAENLPQAEAQFQKSKNKNDNDNDNFNDNYPPAP
jgi:hypothetical protein